MAVEQPQKPKSKRGFAAMDSTQQRQIASKGGKHAHALGTAHEFSRDEAIAAGRKGGLIVARDREHMAQLGRLGGLKRGERIRNRKAALDKVEQPQS